jgi:hypothetical protein
MKLGESHFVGVSGRLGLDLGTSGQFKNESKIILTPCFKILFATENIENHLLGKLVSITRLGVELATSGQLKNKSKIILTPYFKILFTIRFTQELTRIAKKNPGRNDPG